MSEEQTPPSVSDALGNAGPLPEIKWRGKTYTVAHPTPRVIATAEQATARLTWDGMQELKDVFDPKEWDKLKAETVAALQGRKWAFGQSLFNAVMSGADSAAVILWACLHHTHPDLTIADVRTMLSEAEDEATYAVAMVSPGFFSEGAKRLPLAPEKQTEVGEALAAQVKASFTRG